MADASSIISAILGNSTALRQLGREIAMGMRETSGYSSTTPSGGEAAGKAGGRGPSRAQEIERAIKSQQLHTKAQKRVIEDYRDLTKILSSNKKGFKEVKKNLDIFSRSFNDRWDDAMRRVASSAAAEAKLRKQVTAALGREKEITLEGILELRERQLKLEKKIQNAQGQVTPAVIRNVKEYRKISTALGDASNNLSSFSETTADAAKSVVKEFFSMRGALANMSIALAQITTDFRAQMRVGSQTNLIDSQFRAIAAGVDPAALTEMMGSARQVQAAFGDAVNFTNLLIDEQRSYYRFIGDTTEAMRFVSESFTLLGKSGIRPTADALNAVGSSFKMMNQLAGVTSEQFHGMMEGLLMDTEIRSQLQAAKEGERSAIVAGIAKQLELNTAMGMTVEQSLEAAKALGRLGGESAKDRFKRAAQTQMMMGAMGVQGGARAAELIRKGQRITPGEKQELQGLMSSVANEAAQSRRGQVANEMMVDTMMDKTGMGQYLGKDSPFVTTMTAALKPQPEQLEHMVNETTRGANYLETLVRYSDIVQNFLVNGALGKMLVGIAQLIGAYVLGKAALRTAGKLGLGAAGAAAGASAAVVGTALVGAGLGAAIGTGIYAAIDDTEAGIGLSEKIGKLTDAITLYTGVGDEAAAEERMMQRVAEETRIWQERQAATQERQVAIQERQLEETRLQTALQQGLIDKQTYTRRMEKLDADSMPVARQ